MPWGGIVDKSNTILVTGAAGLIGRRVAEMLVASGRTVCATDREPHHACPFDFVAANLIDATAIASIVGRGFGGVIHCGAISGPMLGRDDPAGTIATNVQGTATLLEAARCHSIKRFVFCSSVSAYGSTPPGMSLVPPTAPLNANDIYGASKAAADILVRAYASEHGLDAAVLRIGWVYGPRRQTRSLLLRLIRDALEGRSSRIEHDGLFHMPLIHVDDVARCLIAALDQKALKERAFNVTTGSRVRMKTLADIVRLHLPDADITFSPGVPYPDIEQATFDIDGTRESLGWTPQVALDKGVASYIEWLRTHPL
jgi:UDP-glucuronate 4-epimerase